MPGPLLLNIGCGRLSHRDWVNLDERPAAPSVMRYRPGDRLPFADASADAIYIPELLDRLPEDGAVALLHEARRVLKPGGVLRVVVLDLESLCKACLEGSGGATDQQDERSRADATGIWVPAGPVVPFPRIMTARNGAGDHRKSEDMRPQMSWTSMLKSALAGLFNRHESAADAAINRPPRIYDRHSLARLLSGCGFERLELLDAVTSGIPGYFHMELDSVDAQPRLPHVLYAEARPRPAGAQPATIIPLTAKRPEPDRRSGPTAA